MRRSAMLLLPLLLLSQLNLFSSANADGEGSRTSQPEPLTLPLLGASFANRVTTKIIHSYSTAFTPGKVFTLRCVVSVGTFQGWVKDAKVVGVSEQLEVRMQNSSDFGIYTCVSSSGQQYFGSAFLVTEMPSDSTPVTEVSVQNDANATLRCRAASSSGSYTWHRFNEQRLVFEEMPGRISREIALDHAELAAEENGFTFYKCLPDVATAGRDSGQAFRLLMEPQEEFVDGKLTKVYSSRVRSVPVDAAAVPTVVIPGSKVTFECEKTSPSDTARWYFRSQDSVNYTRLSADEDLGSVNVSDSALASVLSVTNFTWRNKGYYRCSVGRVDRFAMLDIAAPTELKILDHSKGEYDMSAVAGDENELRCEMPTGGEVQDAVWRLVPPASSGSPFDLGVNQQASGFRSSVSDAGVRQLAAVSFSDSAALNGYRLECRLGDQLDYVMLRFTGVPVIIRIHVQDSKFPNYKSLRCSHPADFLDVKFHINDRKEDPISAGQDTHSRTNNTPNSFYFRPMKPQHWFRCSGVNAAGSRIFSDPVPLFQIPRIQVLNSRFPNYKLLQCSHPADLLDIKFHINDRKEDPISDEYLEIHGRTSNTQSSRYFRPMKPQHWFRCSGVNAAGGRIFSDPVPLVP